MDNNKIKWDAYYLAKALAEEVQIHSETAGIDHTGHNMVYRCKEGLRLDIGYLDSEDIKRVDTFYYHVTTVKKTFSFYALIMEQFIINFEDNEDYPEASLYFSTYYIEY